MFRPTRSLQQVIAKSKNVRNNDSLYVKSSTAQTAKSLKDARDTGMHDSIRKMIFHAAKGDVDNFQIHYQLVGQSGSGMTAFQYRKAICGLVASNKIIHAQRVYMEALQRNIEFSQLDFDYILTHYTKFGHLHLAYELWQQMVEKYGYASDDSTCSLLVSLIKSDSHSYLKQVHSILDHIQDKNIELGAASVSMVVLFFAKHGTIAEILKWFDRAMHVPNVNKDTVVNTLIQTCFENQTEADTLNVLSTILKYGYNPWPTTVFRWCESGDFERRVSQIIKVDTRNALIFRSMLHYVNMNNLEKLNVILKLVSESKTHSLNGFQVQYLIRQLVDKGHKDFALQVFQNTKKNKVTLSASNLDYIIGSFLSINELQYAYVAWNEMVTKYKVVAASCTSSLLVKMIKDDLKNTEPQIRTLINHLIANKVDLKPATLVMLVVFYSRYGTVEETKQYFDIALKEPNVTDKEILFNQLIYSYLRFKRIDEAIYALEQMESIGVAVNRTVMSYFLRFQSSKDAIETMRHVINTYGYKPDETIIENYLLSCKTRTQIAQMRMIAAKVGIFITKQRYVN